LGDALKASGGGEHMYYIKQGCPECDETLMIGDCVECAREEAEMDGAVGSYTDEVVCEECGATIEITINCEVLYNYTIEDVHTLSIADIATNRADGRYEINNEIIVIENGEVIERYMAPDENQMVLPI